MAIDGPAGSGKSTVARGVADVTGLAFLDTGAMYRAITLGVMNRGVACDDPAAVVEILGDIAIRVRRGFVSVDGVDATTAVRGAEVTANVSAVSAVPQVRARLVELQRDWIVDNAPGVLEGRDIGTVVAPAAAVKVFLTASIPARARRRAAEFGLDPDQVAADLERRDAADSSRVDSPLTIADDAIVVDTTEMSIHQVVGTVAALARSAGMVPEPEGE